jgi:NADH-quinone oxidoreductase subunit E
MTELDEAAVLAITASYGDDPQQLIAALLDIQDASGRSYVDPRWAGVAARAMGGPDARVYEILTFYSMISTEPRGERVVEACVSAPCLFNGARERIGWLASLMGVEGGGTSADGLFTLEESGCCGRCAGAPAVRVGDEAFTLGTEGDAERLLRSYRDGDPSAREGIRCRD